jgi:phosphoribosylformylglycinamidine cyclo-ligase
MSDPYKDAGVNVEAGDSFSSVCGRACQATYGYSQFVTIHDFSKGHFRGRRGYSFKNLPSGFIESAGSDGIGTKTIITSAANDYRHSARDLLAMVGGDFTRDGGLPLIFMNHLDVHTLGDGQDDPAFRSALDLLSGLVLAAADQHYVLLGGETAELNDCVTSENKDAFLKYNWGGVMIGVIHPDKLITGENVRPGNRVIALQDTTRSNGISLLRRGLRKRYGEEWYRNPSGDRQLDIEQAAAPSVLYDKFLAHMNGWTSDEFEPIVRAHLIAHLSGGGIQSKFGDDLLFSRGFSATLDNLWDPPQVMKNCSVDLSVSDEKCYEVWGCGNGALVVVDESEVETFMRYATKFEISARDAGPIEKTPAGRSPEIKIRSGFTGDMVTLVPKEEE